jgi:broad specificity phosphatase PhoE
MKQENKSYGFETAQLVDHLCQKGISKKLVVMRHSARHYDLDNPLREPFLGLTTEGKAFSYRWGKELPWGLHLHFFSSFISRCIETAYLIDKGYVASGGTTEHTIIENSLGPYYVRDAAKLLGNYLRVSNFFADWFGGHIPEKIIDHPRRIAQRMRNFCKERLSLPDEGTMNICITHDWNVYVLIEAFFGLSPEAYGKVKYLDGIVVFKDRDRSYIEAPGQQPVELS